MFTHAPLATLLTVLALAESGCIAGEGRAQPLYPPRNPPPKPSEVAHLGGYVKQVDGKNVSQGTYDLLPGCHLVRTPSRWGSVSPNAGGVVATTGELTFALPMKAERYYSIEVEIGVMSGPTGSVAVVAYEKDAEGNTTQKFGPATSADDIQRCQQDAPSSPIPLE